MSRSLASVNAVGSIESSTRTGRVAASWIVRAAVTAAFVTGTALAGPAYAGNDDAGKGCNDATIKGDYGIQVQGTRLTPAGMESFIGVVRRTYDGRGAFEQTSNIKGSITGVVPDQPGFGTYQVDADCTGSVTLEPAPGVFIVEEIVIVQRGREIRTMSFSPPPLMATGVQKRMR